MDVFSTTSAFTTREKPTATLPERLRENERTVNETGSSPRPSGEELLTRAREVSDARQTDRPTAANSATERTLSAKLVEQSVVEANESGVRDRAEAEISANADETRAAEQSRQSEARQDALSRSAENDQAAAAARNEQAAAAAVRNEQAAAAAENDQAQRSERRDGELSAEEKAAVAELKARDAEVRAHERAHKAAAGEHAGAVSLETEQGPDGRQYAVAGEVPIDISAEADPQATIDKMETVVAAALAPAEPSSQDQAVARAAEALRLEAVAQLLAERQEEAQEAHVEKDDARAADTDELGRADAEDARRADAFAQQGLKNPYAELQGVSDQPAGAELFALV